MASFKNAFLTLVIACLAFSCKEEKKQAEKPSASQMQEVLAIHDAVMPKMGVVGTLVGKLKSKIDTTDQGRAYENAMKDLQAANKDMMDWMQGFGTRFDPQEVMEGKALSEEKQEWLKEEMVKIEAVKEKINSSIQNAEALIRE